MVEHKAGPKLATISNEALDFMINVMRAAQITGTAEQVRSMLSRYDEAMDALLAIRVPRVEAEDV